MARFMRNTVTGHITTLADDDTAGFQALVVQRQPGGHFPLYEETSSADAADESPDPILPLESGSGGSVDLSAVDQDIALLNHHVVSYVGVADDDEGQQNIGWDSDLSSLVQKGDTTAGATSVTWVDPFNAATQVNISTAAGQARILLQSGGGFAGMMVNSAGAATVFDDIAWPADRGPLVYAPDGGLWRLGVANDGTPTSTLVTPAP